MTAILGLNAYHGDAAAALVIDGELVAAAEEERFNRVKHCAGFPALAARWCLEDAGLSPVDLDHVAVSRDPRANLGRKLLRTIRHGASARYLKQRLAECGTDPRRRPGARGGARRRSGRAQRCTTSSTIRPTSRRRSSSRRSRTPRSSRWTASATSRRRCSPQGHGNHFDVLERVLYPHSLGIFYTAVTQWLGFPALRRRGEGDGSRAVRRRRAISRRCASSSSSTGRPLRARARLLHARQGRRRHELGRRGLRRSGASTPSNSSSSSAPAREPDGRDHRASTTDVAASLQAMLEEAYLHLVGYALGAHEHPEPLPRRRRCAERRGERTHPPGDAVRAALRAARRGRLRDRGRRRVSTCGTRCSGSRADS